MRTDKPLICTRYVLPFGFKRQEYNENKRKNQKIQQQTEQTNRLFRTINQYIADRYSYVTINSYQVLFGAQHWNIFQILSSDTRDMGRFLDVVRCELSVT